MTTERDIAKVELRKHSADLVTRAILLVALVLALRVGCLTWSPGGNEPEVDHKTEVSEHSCTEAQLLPALQGISELQVAEVDLQAFASCHREIRRPVLPDGSIDCWVLLSGNTQAGIDLASLDASDFEVTTHAGRAVARVTLPEPTITLVDISPTQTRWDYTSNLVWNADHAALDLRSELLAEARSELENSAIRSGLIAEAQQNTSDAVTRILMQLGVTEVHTTFTDGTTIRAVQEGGDRCFSRS